MMNSPYPQQQQQRIEDGFMEQHQNPNKFHSPFHSHSSIAHVPQLQLLKHMPSLQLYRRFQQDPPLPHHQPARITPPAALRPLSSNLEPHHGAASYSSRQRKHADNCEFTTSSEDTAYSRVQPMALERSRCAVSSRQKAPDSASLQRTPNPSPEVETATEEGSSQTYTKRNVSGGLLSQVVDIGAASLSPRVAKRQRKTKKMRAPLRILWADASNFRAMVQQLTGISGSFSAEISLQRQSKRATPLFKPHPMRPLPHLNELSVKLPTVDTSLALLRPRPSSPSDTLYPPPPLPPQQILQGSHVLPHNLSPHTML